MRNILITGATSGLGEAIAKRLAKKGDNLILTGRNKENLSRVVAEIKAENKVNVWPLLFDVRDFEECKRAVESIPAEFQPIDVLVNNAGLALELDPVHTGSLEDWNQMIDSNVKGLLYMTKLVSPQMVERRSGHIINMGSTASHEVYGGGAVYCATKHAVLALSKGMRSDFLPYGIKVTQISPGAVETNFSLVRFHGDKAKADKVYEGYQPLVAEDVADVVDYVLSLPAHVCLNEVVMTCTAQFNGAFHKEK
ncbi:MAG: SDR family NAD(P)-dependent oxidoreductase [Bacteroidales bacterium]|nr:SDR family NAD(P)-dependent oxidoreductase [Bacteroidales bacterium]